MPQPEKDLLITISTKTILKVLAVLLILWIAYITRHILLILFVSLILAALIDPLADWFQSKKIPRGLAVIVVYIVLIALVTLISVLLVPTIVTEAKELIRNFSTLWQTAIDKLGFLGDLARQYNLVPSDQNFVRTLQPSATKTVQGIFSTIGSFFVGIASVLLTAAITFYMVVEEDALKKMVRALAPDHYQPFLNRVLHRIRGKLGAWLRGQMVLSLTVGILMYVGLSILGVPYAALLGLMAALAELVPYVGQLIVGTIAIFLTFSQTGTAIKPLFVLVLMVLIQQFENHILVPKVMEKAVGLNPIISIVALLVGAQLAGIVGALLAIPVATSISVVIQELTQKED